jgi:CheY-like chemotaxis protein
MRDDPTPAGEARLPPEPHVRMARRRGRGSIRIGSSGSSKGGPILLVEDDAADAHLMMAALKSAGIPDSVFWVSTGEEALEYLEGAGAYSDRKVHPIPCLILLDLKLSKLSGFHVLKRQRERPELRGVSTIVVTGSLNPSDIDRAYDLGAQSYIIKPLVFAELVATLGFKVNLCLQRTIHMKVDVRNDSPEGFPDTPVRASENNGN